MTKGFLPCNQLPLEDLIQAMVLAEQTQKATQTKPAITSADNTDRGNSLPQKPTLDVDHPI